MLAGLHLLAGPFLYANPMFSGVLDGTMEVRFECPDSSIIAGYNNGLRPGQRESYYHLSQGAACELGESRRW